MWSRGGWERLKRVSAISSRNWAKMKRNVVIKVVTKKRPRS